ncbi:hypothetical protein D9Q98_005829 [Chlorella vulgaris]|uniref:Uncharacterized protein n=1 Tax=Chlorella vulgaris TaxID=3077 RepID=A0A9D4Z1A7_CHLVU|nr:hypothetical protein D9Q98_005829 [Chlorella vulgaris]
MSPITGATHSATQLASGLRSGGGMRSATSVPLGWRATVLLNRRTASRCGGVPHFQPTAGRRKRRRRRDSPPPPAVPRRLDLLQRVISLDENTWLAIFFNVAFWSFIAVCLQRGGSMYFDATIVLYVWVCLMSVLRPLD